MTDNARNLDLDLVLSRFAEGGVRPIDPWAVAETAIRGIAPGRSQSLTDAPFSWVASAAAAGIVVAIVGLMLVGPPRSSDVGIAPPPLVASPSASAEPSPSLPPFVPPGLIEPGRYRVMWPRGVQMAVVFPAGWIGDERRIRSADAPIDIDVTAFLPGDADEVTSIFRDACRSADEPRPVGPALDDFIAALDDQVGTDVVVTPFSAGIGVGRRVALRLTPGIDRNVCGDGGPLRIWPGWSSLASGYRGVIYAFEVDNRRAIFAANLNFMADAADEHELDSIIESFEFVTP
jgi:hypothetical protein